MQASVALEIALLVLLCSTNKDICDDTSRCLGTLCQEARIVDLDEGIELNHITIACNAKVYEQLCCDDSRYIGRKAQQKRIRKYLRMLPHHTPGNMAAWEESLKRWKQLTQWLIRTAEDDEKREERSVEWQNYTGFLAALGGCCLAQDFEFDGKFASDRRISMPVDAAAMADTFIGEMIELLVSENVYMRGGVKDALGNDLAPALYVLLFRHLETFMSKCFDTNGDAIRSPHNKLFVEQSVLVLRLILDRLVDPGDCLLSIDFSTLLNQFADYLNGLPNTYVTLRVKVQMCFLVEAVMQKKDHIVIRDEIRLRNKLLEICVEWTSDFAMVN
jgi:neurofibromin 1